MRVLALLLALGLLQQPPSVPIVAVKAGPASLPVLPLLTPQSLTYRGAFRLPNLAGYGYGGLGLGYSAVHNSLFLQGHVQLGNMAAEISIPTPLISNTVAALPRAQQLQGFQDPSNGQSPQIGTGANTPQIGGLLPWGQSLISSWYVYYDGNGQTSLSHFRSSLTMQNAIGASQLGTPLHQAGFMGGYMAEIPAVWQQALGGPALTGQCCIPIASRTSYGPSVSVFDPMQVGQAIVPATQLLAYPIAHPTLGACAGNAIGLYNCASGAAGVVFPTGTRSILFFGTRGTGPYCYGPGTSNPAQAGTPAPPNGVDPWCFDPSNDAKGPHAFPYEFFVWAYDVLDLIAVRNGTKQKWDVLPYQTWTFTLPFTRPDSFILKGAAFDPTTRRIFLTQYHGDGDASLIQVFTVQP